MTHAELLEHGSEQRPGKRRFPAEGAAQRTDESFGVHVLLEVTGRSGPDRFEELALVRLVGEHHDLGVGHARADPSGRSDAAPAQIGVDQAQSRPLAERSPQRRAPVRGLRADLEAVSLKEQPESLPRGQLRLRDQDARALARHQAPPAAGVTRPTDESTTLCPCAF